MQPPLELRDRINYQKFASLPQTTLRLIQTCNDPDAEFEDIAAIVQSDTGLASKTLLVANSPLYAQWGRIDDLERMLVVLGLNTIKTIAMTSGMMQLLSDAPAEVKPLQQRVWYRSLLGAQLARSLAPRLAAGAQDNAYLAGLLHRVGQLVLLNIEPGAYRALLTTATDNAGLMQKERGRFGITQAELGAWLIDKWQLGEFVAEAVLYQFETPRKIQDAPPLIQLVNLASALSDPWRRDAVLNPAATILGVTTAELQELIRDAGQEADKIAESFGIAPEHDDTAAPEPSPPRDTQAGDESGFFHTLCHSALLDSVKAAMWSDPGHRNPVAVVQTFFMMLFGIDRSLLFLIDKDGLLQGVPGATDDTWLKHMRVRPESGRSLIADTLLRKTSLDSFTYLSPAEALSVFDRQLIGRLGHQGMLGIPLVTGGRVIGVLAAGINAAATRHGDALSELMNRFAAEAAAFLHARAEKDKEKALLAAEAKAETTRVVRKARHEINNPLGIISNYLHILSSKLGSENPVQQELEIVQEEIDRVGNLLLDLTGRLTTPEHASNRPNLNELIDSLLAILQLTLFEPRKIRVKKDLDADLPLLDADPDKVKQIVLNLLKNAAEALPVGGEIRIRTRGKIYNERGRWVELGIRDDGPGLPDNVQRQIFLPVDSTKGGSHSGLGIAIVGQLVRELKGSIQCSTGHGGTDFAILLPQAAE